MSDKEHESQRSLVELSLRLCPEGGRHKAKGHEAKQRALRGRFVA